MTDYVLLAKTLILVPFILAEVAMAHPGSLDANGGHHDHQNGGYHYHNGQSSGSGNGASQSYSVPSSPVYRRAMPSKPRPHWRELYAPRYPRYRIVYKKPKRINIKDDNRADEVVDGGPSRKNRHEELAFSHIYGRVVEVIDGDTLRVILSDNSDVTIRLYGIDCPELSQPFGTEARDFASEFCLNEAVMCQVREEDKYGRLIGYVTLLDGLSGLNHELVKVGLAHWYQKYAPEEKALEMLEAAARIQRRGLWSQTEPVFPWVYRAEN